MFITYDPLKNARNIRERGLSFEDVVDLNWESAFVFEDRRFDYGESRMVAIAFLDDRLHVVCFTETDDGIRVISFRKANRKEVSAYEQKTAH